MRDTWFSRRFYIRPYADGVYPHPGLWLTDSDSLDEGRVHELIVWVDVRLLAPLLCKLGYHRWISTRRPDTSWKTACWYCKEKLDSRSRV